ncbi:RNA 3'-terminal phosphate cyclase [Leucobacter sp. 7(1)]|uniref:type II toxin-antitoxin system PemK/MazF family toxin n=1 Tax=Leucobacter sp. 7(1) TaxID=1255613 RepID=UPI00097EC398|nr:type II toxin-antitoxin system PemK/MazF family toxin [Leucobacter sp. 7(1)]SJN08156.1 RNA 3'-terminal phosphate cyclase [Leucobacter sp. 7(1)]
MSGSSGRWADFLRSFLDAFLRAARKGTEQPGNAQPGKTKSGKTPSGRRTGGAPKPSDTAERSGVRSGATERDYDYSESPGQYGDGATRDLTAAETRGLRVSYAPQVDGDPDPGEIVWTWVPYVENDGRGKDRPVLIIARLDVDTTAGCYLSTKQHRDFVSIGSGPWDSQGRESFLSPERLLRVTHDGMRREGTVLPRERFEPAVAALLRARGLSG